MMSYVGAIEAFTAATSLSVSSVEEFLSLRFRERYRRFDGGVVRFQGLRFRGGGGSWRVDAHHVFGIFGDAVNASVVR